MPLLGLLFTVEGGSMHRPRVGDLGGSLAVLESELERALGVRV